MKNKADKQQAAPACESPAYTQASLRVYTLGRFTLVRDGEPLHYPRKSPAMPLQLLKALIANGGRQVAAQNLSAILWPDKEGDRALKAFDTTLHRLRKYLGDDNYLVMEDGRLTLNSDLVWVDVWECERQLGRLRDLLVHQPDECTISAVTDCEQRVMRFYQGHFLAREASTCWSVSLEERLRSRFVHSMLELGRFWEKQQQPARAVLCYRKGIEVDDLLETFYQRLMVCLDLSGRQPEAIAVYRQCRHILSVTMGLQPTGQTTEIYTSILAGCKQQAG